MQRNSRSMRKWLSDDSGSLTITAAGTIAALVSLLLVVVLVSREAINVHRARVAAEVAAVSAAFNLVSAPTSDPCARAREVASKNATEVVSCKVSGVDVIVQVQRGKQTAISRAGPL